MNSSWTQVRLGDIATTNSSSYSEKEGWSFANYLDTGNITENRIDDIQKIDLKIEKLPSRAKRKVKQGDIIYSTVRPIQKHYGIIKEFPEHFLVSTGFTTISASLNINSNFIYYFLIQNEIIDHLQTLAEQTVSTYPAIKASDIEDLIISLPPLFTQRAIAATLSCFDDKIELNNRINANLEAQAQVIFKSWFVDFEPFQGGKFVDSELGKIPEGCRVGSLGEIADITMGQSPDGSSYNETGNGTVFYQGRAEFGWRYPMNRLYTTEPKRMAKKGNILMSVRAPVGDINVANEDCCIGRGLAAINSKHTSFILYTMKSLKIRLDMFNGEGTVFGSINKDNLNDMKIIIPIDKSIRDFEAVCATMDKQIFNNEMESRALAAIRDALLPKLMSGEIEVEI